MPERISVIKVTLGGIAAVGSIVAIIITTLSLTSNSEKKNEDDLLITEGLNTSYGCGGELKDPVLINFCRRLQVCKFDLTQCTNECPFGYVLDDNNCPTSCKCGSSGLFNADIGYKSDQIPSMLDSFGYIDESEVVSVFSGSTIVPGVKRGTGDRWEKGADGLVKVPYQFLGDMKTKLTNWDKAMQWFNDNTCIRFNEIDASEVASTQYYMKIANGVGCSNNLGRVRGGNTVSLELQTRGTCDEYSTILHELFHGLGFVHEQCRPDRDEHLAVLWALMKPEGKSEYKKLKPNMVYDYGQAYDIKSIMQYHAASFSLNGWVAVMHDLTDPTNRMEDNKEPTESDKMEVNMLYQCDSYADKERVVATEPPDNVATTVMTKVEVEPAKGYGWMQWGGWSRSLKKKKKRWRGCKVWSPLGESQNMALCFEEELHEEKRIKDGEATEEEWEKWGEWYPCAPKYDIACNGNKLRFRNWIPGSAKDGGSFMMQNAVDEKECKIEGCAMESYNKKHPSGGETSHKRTLWNHWSAWWPIKECSVTCGGGTQKFWRQCRNAQALISKECNPPDISEEFKDDECNTQACGMSSPGMSSPINDELFGWNKWGQWSECSGGEHTRFRTCQGINMGMKCHGSAYDNQKCLTAREQADLQYTAWGEWGECLLLKTGTCAGSKYRFRSCLKNDECDMKGATEMKACYRCSHGEIKWTPWKNSECSATCQGSMRRKRDCIDSSTNEASSQCVGTKEETVPCNTQSCDSKPKRSPTVFAVESSETKTTPCKDETSKWVFGNFNGGKKVEAICTGTSGNLQLMGLIENNNAGSILWTGRLYECMGDDVIKYAADINGDQVDDLICKRETSGLYHIHLMMYGKFSAVPDYSTTLCGEDETPTFLNLNGDLRNDALCWNKQSGKMNIFINQITG